MAVLGDLEQHVMAVLWRADAPLAVRDVHERLHYSRPVAYTTVMTVLDRLAKKDAVVRARDGKAWIYRATKSCVDLHVDEILTMLSGCGAGHADQILTAVRERVGEVVLAGQTSCLTTGDPAWTPEAAQPASRTTRRDQPAGRPATSPRGEQQTQPVVGRVAITCTFAKACRAAHLDCTSCPSRKAS